MSTQDKPWSTKQVAEYFGVNSRTVLRWAAEEGMPHMKLSPKVVRFDPAKVREYSRVQEEHPESRVAECRATR